jgi:hypothetical protein
MGCDYYIRKALIILLNDDTTLDIELELERGYYGWDFEDEDEEKVKQYKERILTPRMQPMVVYENNCLLETKYKTLVEKKINQHGRQWTDIAQITKIEERYQRE